MVLDLQDVTRVATEAAQAALPPGLLSGLSSEDAVDLDGRDSLSLTVVLRGDGHDITGDQALDLVYRVKQAIARFGDDRPSAIWFTTEVELTSAVDVDPEA